MFKNIVIVAGHPRSGTHLVIDTIRLNFKKADSKRYPMIKLLKLLPNKHSLYETILVSANDTLVNLFLSNMKQFHHKSMLFYLKGSCHERGRIEKILWNKFETINTPLFSMNHHTEF